MEILFLNHNVAHRGGTFFRAFHIARRLVSRGHAVTLLTISENRRSGCLREALDGVEIVHTPDLLSGVGRTGWDLWDTANRIGFLRGKEWDIIHAWDCRPVVILPALYARRCSRARSGKLVIDWCDWWGRGGVQSERQGWSKLVYSPVETFFEEAFRTLADATTVASDALRRRALTLGVPDRDMMILPGGSDPDAVHPMDMAEARAALNLPQDNSLIGYMGKLPAPEVSLLLDSVSRVRDADKGAGLLAIGVSIAGSGKTFREIAGERWGDWVIETGRIPFAQVGTYLAACNALVLPMRDTVSNGGRWPSKINDYFASGRPVVATRVGAIVEFVENHRAAVLTGCDSASIANELLMLRSSPTLAADIGARGRRLAEGDLNWDNIVDRLLELYCRIGDGEIPGIARPALSGF